MSVGQSVKYKTRKFSAGFFQVIFRSASLLAKVFQLVCPSNRWWVRCSSACLPLVSTSDGRSLLGWSVSRLRYKLSLEGISFYIILGFRKLWKKPHWVYQVMDTLFCQCLCEIEYLQEKWPWKYYQSPQFKRWFEENTAGESVLISAKHNLV